MTRTRMRRSGVASLFLLYVLVQHPTAVYSQEARIAEKPRPPNDVCSQSIPVLVSSDPLSVTELTGSFLGAQIEEDVPVCWEETAVSVWYNITVEDATQDVLLAVVCDDSATLQLYDQGNSNNDCSMLNCNKDGTIEELESQCTEYSWNLAVEQNSWWILRVAAVGTALEFVVQLQSRDDMTTMAPTVSPTPGATVAPVPFQRSMTPSLPQTSISPETLAPTSSIPDLPPSATSEACLSASTIELLENSTTTTILGTTFNIDVVETTLPACGEATIPVAAGAWFVFLADSVQTLVATTCLSEGETSVVVDDDAFVQADYDAQITILTGNDCSEFQCVSGGKDDCGTSTTNSDIRFTTVPGQAYYIFVHGTFPNTSGNFLLSLHSVPEHEVCELAVPLELNIIAEESSTMYANVPADVPACGMAESPATRGLWYSFTTSSIATTLLATTCTGNPDHDLDVAVQLSIFTSCDTNASSCVAGADGTSSQEACNGGAGVIWEAQANTQYFILVHNGQNSEEVGAFSLVVREVSSLAPTMAPTGTPLNDLCSDTKDLPPLVVNEIVEGSTTAATIDENVPACGSATAPTAPGVWYQVLGNGKTLKASTCTNFPEFDGLFDSQISVFRGGCLSLGCVVGTNDDVYEPCEGAATAVWQSEPDELYSVLVHGFANATGPFVFSIREAATNDYCENAIPLPMGVITNGTTSGASPDMAFGCGSAATQSSSGVWYTVNGTGTNLVVTTCVSDVDTSDFDTQIHVFQGECEDQICVDGNDDDTAGSCEREAGVRWFAEVGVVYRILVHGFRSGTGDFAILVQDLDFAPTQAPTGRPFNDFCEDAIPLLPGQAIVGSTAGATSDNTGVCGETSVQVSGGVWYSFLGDGLTYLFSTCVGDPDARRGLDTEMKIYTGSCGNLTCVDGNDDDNTDLCAIESGLIVTTSPGELYYILIHGFGTNIGEFMLAATATSAAPTTAPLANDDCEGALGPLMLDEIITSSLAQAKDSAVTQQCGQAMASTTPGLWYSYTTDVQRTVLATTCTGNPDHDLEDATQIVVYEGSDCGVLSCVTGSIDNLRDNCVEDPGAIWTAQPGTTYWLLVQSLVTSPFEDFSLVLRESTPSPTMAPTGVPANDVCEQADGPLPEGALRQGTTVGATADGMPSCGLAGNQTAPGVWYTVMGTGTPLQASTCTLYTQFDSLMDSQISIFRGTAACGDTLECVTGNDDDPHEECSRSSTAVWDSVEGELYYVLVHGFDGSTGPFVLSLREGPPNDECEQALAVPVNGPPVSGTIQGARLDGADACGLAGTQRTGGVWYTVEGTGGVVLATTCTDDNSTATTTPSDFNVQLSVFMGSTCNSQECIAGSREDFTCSNPSEAGVLWETVANETYYILVHGAQLQTGSFTLSVRDATVAPTTSPTLPPANDFCDTAEELFLDQVVAGSTIGTSNDFMGPCGTALEQSSNGVWYFFEGNGTTVKATTCHGDETIEDDFFDSQMKVFTGSSCANLTCVDGNDDDFEDTCGTESGVIWFAAKGELYRILVHGFGSRDGQFGIVVRSFEDDAGMNTTTRWR